MTLANLTMSGWVFLGCVLAVLFDFVSDIAMPERMKPLYAKDPIGDNTNSWNPILLGVAVTWCLWLMTAP